MLSRLLIGVSVFAALSAGTVALSAESPSLAKAGFLGGCLVLSLWARRRDPWDCLLMTFWIATLTPLVRRLVDQQAGWDATNIMLAAPFVAALPMGPSVLRRVRALDRPYVVFPAIALLSIFYGFAIDLTNGDWGPAFVGAVNWAIPLLYCFFVLAHADRISELVARLPQFIAWNLLLLGGYGLVQFAVFPSWDRFWMLSAQEEGYLTAAPLNVQVFSTLNSHGPFAFWMMTQLVLSFGFSCRLTRPAQAIGLAALLLSADRTAWIGATIAVVVMAIANWRAIARYASGIVAVAAVVGLVMTTVPAINDAIASRAATLLNLPNDGSLLERMAIFGRAWQLIIEHPLGLGIGAFGRGAVVADPMQQVFAGPIDNGVLEILGSLGWFFGFAFLAAVVAGLIASISDARSAAPSRRVAFSAGAACVAALPITNVTTGIIGTTLWFAYGLAAAMGGVRRAAAIPVEGRSPGPPLRHGDGASIAMSRGNSYDA